MAIDKFVKEWNEMMALPDKVKKTIAPPRSCRPDVDHAWWFMERSRRDIRKVTGIDNLPAAPTENPRGADWYETAADEIQALINRTPRSPTKEEIIATLKGVV